MKKLSFLCLLLLFIMAANISLAIETLPVEKNLRITEVMASNHETLEDAFGRYPDWLEIHNASDEAISLEGVFISDKRNEPERYAFPEGAVIQPREYIIVYASGAKKDIADEYHTSFKLSAAGEALYLSRDGILLDSMFFGAQESDISLALNELDEYVQTLTPTPGYENQITPVS